MITIKTIERIRRGGRITYFNGIYAMITGFLYVVFFWFILNTDFHAIKAVWPVFVKYNPEISSLFMRLLVIKGIFILSIGLIMVYLSSYILKKKDKYAWYVLFIIGILFWGSLLVIEILNRNLYTITLASIGWLMFLIGMLIPIKYYLKNDYDEDY